jgi:hypothetical protein
MDRTQYLKRLRERDNVNSQIASKINLDATALLGAMANKLEVEPLQQINLSTIPEPTTARDYFKDLLVLMTDYIPSVDKVEEVLNIINDRNENYIKQMALNFNDFKSLFKDIGKRRITVTELTDQIENKLKEILVKKNISTADIPAINMTAFDGIQEIDNPKILRSYLSTILSINVNSSFKEIIHKHQNASPDLQNYIDNYIEYIKDQYRKELLPAVIETFSNLNKHGFDAYPARLTHEFFHKLKNMVNKKIDNIPNLQHHEILYLKYFPEFKEFTDENDPNYPENQFEEIQSKIQIYFTDCSTIALHIIDTFKPALNNLLKALINHYRNNNDLGSGRNDAERNKEVLEKEKLNQQKMQEERESRSLRGRNFQNELEIKKGNYKEQALHVADHLKLLADNKDKMFNNKNKKDVANHALHNLSGKSLPTGRLNSVKCFHVLAQEIGSWNATDDTDVLEKRKQLLLVLFPSTHVTSPPLDILISPHSDYVVSHRGHGLDKPPTKVGKGLQAHHKVINNKYYVDTRALGSGLLELRYVKNGHLTPFKSMTLQNDVHKVVSDIVHKGGFSNADYAKLTPMSKDMVNRFGGFIGLPVNHDDMDKFQKEFNIVRGELSSGNNSQMLKDKMRKMLHYAVDVGKITRHQMNKMMLDLNL